ncbi:hypothetical protein [Chitinibacter sp. GC72]|uniref:hypothetical protein n=1 Tax=Chitinibacter sp. GC72 TaxID=1526917 RepID=UPI0012F95A2D|nr:hypothetical protein [Chitinibacter sp. GC72]
MNPVRILGWCIVLFAGLTPINWLRLLIIGELPQSTTIPMLIFSMLIAWAIAGGVGYLLVINARKAALKPVAEGRFFCTACGHQGESHSHTSGSIGIEVVLWICFLIPGLIYSIWRLSSRHDVCSFCGSKSLIPANSPKAVAQKRQMGL